MHIDKPRIYPLKSARGLELDSAEVQPRGLVNDRRWMVVDTQGRFVSARKIPSMVLIDAAVDVDDGTLVLSAPGHESLRIAVPDAALPKIGVEVWQSPCPARAADAAANAWITKVLGGDYRLVHMADDCLRPVSEAWSRDGDIVSFADGFPLLLIGTASLADLNHRLSQPVTMTNFRPNVIVHTDVPFVEDQWKRIRIGAVEFDVCKPCTRCILTTVDPITGIKDVAGEPLATLKTFRRFDIGVTFGQNLIPRGTGVLHAGDQITVLDVRVQDPASKS
jgi:uncharacterized protein